MKKYIVVLAILLLVVTLMVLDIYLQVDPYVTADGIYSAEISERWISIQFNDKCTLNIYQNPGSTTYQYTVDNGNITLRDIDSGEVSTHSFQYLEDENVVVFDGINYYFWAALD